MVCTYQRQAADKKSVLLRFVAAVTLINFQLSPSLGSDLFLMALKIRELAKECWCFVAGILFMSHVDIKMAADENAFVVSWVSVVWCAVVKHTGDFESCQWIWMNCASHLKKWWPFSVCEGKVKFVYWAVLIYFCQTSPTGKWIFPRSWYPDRR